MIRKALTAALVAFSIAGCSTIDTIQKVQEIASQPVPAVTVIQAGNAFNILKSAASRFADYCIAQQMAPAVCSAATRRTVVKAVDVGTGARDRMRVSINDGKTPAPAAIYNLLVGAVQDLKNSPVHSAQFGGLVP